MTALPGTTILLIVARDQARLHHYVSRRLGAEAAIDVVRDRRHRERRQGQGHAPVVDRRWAERRARDVAPALAALGYAIVRRQPSGVEKVSPG